MTEPAQPTQPDGVDPVQVHDQLTYLAAALGGGLLDDDLADLGDRVRAALARAAATPLRAYYVVHKVTWQPTDPGDDEGPMDYTHTLHCSDERHRDVEMVTLGELEHVLPTLAEEPQAEDLEPRVVYGRDDTGRQWVRVDHQGTNVLVRTGDDGAIVDVDPQSPDVGVQVYLQDAELFRGRTEAGEPTAAPAATSPWTVWSCAACATEYREGEDPLTTGPCPQTGLTCFPNSGA